MLDVLKMLTLALRDLFRSRIALEAEVTLLRHQLGTARRRSSSRIQLTQLDRLFLTCLFRFQPHLLHAIHIVKPETLVRWHRIGFRALWR